MGAAYGVAFGSADELAALNARLNRFGGNNTNEMARRRALVAGVMQINAMPVGRTLGRTPGSPWALSKARREVGGAMYLPALIVDESGLGEGELDGHMSDKPAYRKHDPLPIGSRPTAGPFENLGTFLSPIQY